MFLYYQFTHHYKLLLGAYLLVISYLVVAGILLLGGATEVRLSGVPLERKINNFLMVRPPIQIMAIVAALALNIIMQLTLIDDSDMMQAYRAGAIVLAVLGLLMSKGILIVGILTLGVTVISPFILDFILKRMSKFVSSNV